MKNVLKIIIILLVVGCLIGGLLYFVIRNNNKVSEIEPEEEISEIQERQTIVSLYFRNKDTKEIEPEARMIDVKELVDNPYNTLLNFLIEGPKNDKLEKIIPDGTSVKSTKVEKGLLIIDFSEEFINNSIEGKEVEEAMIKSIVNTLTELTEINSIKILINGEENKSFKDNVINFEKEFAREG